MAPRPADGVPRVALPVFGVAALIGSAVWWGEEPMADAEATVDRPVAGEALATAAPPAAAAGSAVAAAATAARERDHWSRPIPEDRYRCRTPEVSVERTPGCEAGLPYPGCRWQLPPPHRAGRSYAVWRNTVDEHLWGRPALVAVVLAAAEEYARHFPGEVVAIGDLDAAGPRHETHDVGVDVDLYLPGMMEVENLGAGEYAENYPRRSPLERRLARARVETLARILATCTAGRLRIYYNDEVVRERFQTWFVQQGLSSPFGRAMQKHNDLHRFHFHVTIAKDVPPPAPAGGST